MNHMIDLLDGFIPQSGVRADQHIGLALPERVQRAVLLLGRACVGDGNGIDSFEQEILLQKINVFFIATNNQHGRSRLVQTVPNYKYVLLARLHELHGILHIAARSHALRRVDDHRIAQLLLQVFQQRAFQCGMKQKRLVNVRDEPEDSIQFGQKRAIQLV